MICLVRVIWPLFLCDMLHLRFLRTSFILLAVVIYLGSIYVHQAPSVPRGSAWSFRLPRLGECSEVPLCLPLYTGANRGSGLEDLAQGHTARQFQSSNLNSLWSLPSYSHPPPHRPLQVVRTAETLLWGGLCASQARPWERPPPTGIPMASMRLPCGTGWRSSLPGRPLPSYVPDFLRTQWPS